MTPVLSADKGPVGYLASVYNPLVWKITTIITLTVPFPNVNITDELGHPVSAQVWTRSPAGGYLLLLATWHPCAKALGILKRHFHRGVKVGVGSRLPPPHY